MKRINFGEKIINYHLIHYEINPTRILQVQISELFLTLH